MVPMKKTILLRGCQGSGKSTLIRDLGLEAYAIGPDRFRELYSTPVPTLDGAPSVVVSAAVTKQVYRALTEAVENRMQMGATIVMDAMHLAAKDQRQWAELGRKYGYETLLVDVQGDATDDELLARNAARGYGQLAEDRILECAEKGRQRNLHDQVRQIHATQITAELTSRILDFSIYNKVVVVGDIHSCAEPLRDAIAEHGGLNNRSIAWVFLGDYFDRGPDAAEVFELLAPERDNVYLVEGNHETNLRRVMHGTAPKDRFHDARITRKQILEAGHRPAEIISLLERTVPHLMFTTGGELFLACHGGVRAEDVTMMVEGMDYSFASIPDHHFIYGSSSLETTYHQRTDYAHIDHLLADPAGPITQFHGHRNGRRDEDPQDLGTVPGVWNLEAEVEAGGHLSVAVIGPDGAVAGHLYASPAAAARQPLTVGQQLAGHPDIRAREIGNGIVAYNFTRDAFQKGRWDELSTAARGLFMRGEKVVARGYEKFFNIDEANGFTREQVLTEFTLPVRVAQKANGFLLIASSVDGKLELFSKSGPTPFADAGRDLFERLFDTQRREAFRALLERTDTSVTFEAILANDPHPILAAEEQIVFLDVIDNSIEFRIRHDLARAVESVLGVTQVPSRVVTTREELSALVAEYEQGDLEGAVLRDAAGRMTKIKAEPYRRVKKLRGPLTRVLEGKATSLPSHDEDMVAYERMLRASGVWDRLSEFAVVNPNGQRVLNLPALLQEAELGINTATV